MRLEPRNALPLTACKARFTFSSLVITPGYKAGAPLHAAVKAIPAPIRIAAHIAHLTLGQFHQLRIAGAGTVNELHTGQIFRAAGIRGTAAKQQRLIAHGLSVDLIHFHLLRGQNLRRHSGNGLAGEFHIQNVILIGDFF